MTSFGVLGVFGDNVGVLVRGNDQMYCSFWI